MLTITRQTARHFHAVLRKAGFRTQARVPECVQLLAGRDGLRLRAVNQRVAVELRLPGTFDPAAFTVPLSTFAQAAGRQNEPIDFNVLSDQQVTVSWHEGRIPKREICSADSHVVEHFDKFPVRGTEPGAENSAALLRCLADAAEIATPDATRYALHCLRLSGSRGSIAATDGGQLLLQDGFCFSWTEDLLVPANGVFRATELPSDQPVQVSRADDWLLFVVGDWTIALPLEKEVRFPRVEDLIHSSNTAVATLTLPDDDVRFLHESLPQLPADTAQHSPVTLDLNGHVALRSRPVDQETPTELVLSRSRYDGEPLRVSMNRNYLHRAVQLGFRTVQLFGTEYPVQCRDEHRTYLWATLSRDGIVPPAEQALRIESAAHNAAAIVATPASASPATSSRPLPTTPKSRLPTIVPASPADAKDGEPSAASVRSPIEQAIALRSTLRTMLNDTNTLIASLKRQQQQSRLVQSTLQSLRQLAVVS